MSTRVYELAKEMNLTNKEMLDKIHGMGMEVKSHMSVVTDMDAVAIKNTILHSDKKSETKIVKVVAREKEATREAEEIKVTIKPAKAVIKSAEAKPQIKSESKEESAAALPQGKTAPKSVIAPNGKMMLQGRPMPKNAVPQGKSTAEKPEELHHSNMENTAEKAPLVTAHEPEHKHTVKEARKDAPKEPVAQKSVDVQPTDGRPEPQRFKIIKTNEEILAKEAEERAQREAKRKQREEEMQLQRQKAQAARPAGDRGTSNRPAGARPDYRPAGTGSGRPDNRPPGARPDYRPAGTGSGRPDNRPPGARPDYRPAGTGSGRPDNRPPGARPDYRPAGTGSGRPDNRPPGARPDYRPAGTGSGRPDNRPPGQGYSPQNKGRKPDSATGPTETVPVKPTRAKKTGPYKKDVVKDPFYKSAKPLDLTKAAPKKHKKSKIERVDQAEENQVEMESLPVGTKIITVPITVKGLSEQIEKTTSQVIMALMKLGIMANINQNIDEDTAVLLGQELGVNIVVGKVDEEIVEEGLELFKDTESDLMPRPPIITVMGHVDHGKTSLLDAIRKTSVTDREAGGITQHIGASEVVLNGNKIVFLDTPGHEAFTAMRARGAHATDIAVLVVAADDSVKPQTIESISHAKAAGVPIIVAINKTDKPGANPERVKQDLTEHGILVEDWGGDTICVPVSAKTGEGIVTLLEMILLQAEVLELKANPGRLAMGTVIEARLDKAKGPVATLLVLNGTLHAGMSVVAGTCSGRIRAMTNFKGDIIRKAGPATAVEILGLTEVPEAGDEFNAVKEDKIAREIAENRRSKLREEVMVRNSSVTLEQLFTQIEEGEVKEINLIIKADVQGSVGALTSSLEKLKNENVKVRIIHSGVGTITESDIMLAGTSNAIVIGFNVRPSTAVTMMADRDGVEIRTYRIIYEVIDDIEAAMKGMLDPVFKEVVMGKIEIREIFKVPGVGMICGAYVLEGKVQRNAQIRLVRDGIVIHEGKISSLRRFKDDMKEVATGYECGIGIENYNDIKEGDIIEAFKMEEIERK